MKRLAIIQARMASTRLPGKVMLDLAGRPVLQHVVERARYSQAIDQVVVATTTDPSDDGLEQFCIEQVIPYFRGSHTDVLDRFYQAALEFHADLVIRLTADCPLIDPELIDRTMAAFFGQSSPSNINDFPMATNHSSPITYPSDFAADRLPPPWERTLPIGLDVEICSFTALQHTWEHAHQAYQREHVMPYLYEGVVWDDSAPMPGNPWYIQRGTTGLGFRIALLNHHPGYGALRWTVDTAADLEFVRLVYARLADKPHFGWQDVLTLLEHEPELASINADVKHKTAFDIDHRTGTTKD